MHTSLRIPRGVFGDLLLQKLEEKKISACEKMCIINFTVVDQRVSEFCDFKLINKYTNIRDNVMYRCIVVPSKIPCTYLINSCTETENYARAKVGGVFATLKRIFRVSLV